MQLLLIVVLIYIINITNAFLYSNMYHSTPNSLLSSAKLKLNHNLNNVKLYAVDGDSNSNIETNDKNDKYKKWLCPSCSYVYDEEKGFKKRYPPGLRWRDIEVFLCPVCGASKSQFEEYHGEME